MPSNLAKIISSPSDRTVFIIGADHVHLVSPIFKREWNV
nr:hypothetical protein [Bacillus sp. Marseille-Q1617]